jgi:peptide/nickel transport system permease protein
MAQIGASFEPIPAVRVRPVVGWRALRLLRQVLRTRLAGAGAVVLAMVLLAALLADVISPHDPNFQDYAAFLQPPSLTHPLGTDDLGRDVLSRIISGARVSLQVGVIAVGIALLAGVTIGLVAGYWGGRLDDVLMRMVDAVQAFPALILALSITAALGPGITNAMIAIGVVATPSFARLTRGQVLSVRERDFVVAAHVLGGSSGRIILRHIWPNVTGPIIVQATLLVATAIITEATLSFLGVGVVPPTPSWGSMLRIGYQYLQVAPWLSIFPGLAIFVTVLGFNFLGDGLRMALDPHLSRRA